MTTPESIQAKINELKLQRSMLDVQKEMVSFRLLVLQNELNILKSKACHCSNQWPRTTTDGRYCINCDRKIID